MKRKIVVLSIGAVFLVCASALFAEDRLVPSVYPTIQAGINAAQPGDTVIVAEGTYTGAGNRDLDFGGSAITVRSANPNNPDVVAATIIDCQGSGRGFYFQSGETSSSVVAGLTITNGYDAGLGGGVYCYGSSPTIEKCTFSSNTASVGGGGVAIESCSPMVVNCIFSGNIGGWYGGGINNYDSSATVKGCIFSGNGSSAGGGLVNFESSATTINCTFSGNYADQGGGIYNYDSSSSTVSNCILWGDTAPDEPEIYGDCSVSYSDVQGSYPGDGNIDADPCFADAMSGDYHLLEGSSCIDGGDPAYSPAPGETDIDGEPRVMGIRVDMGADEFPIDKPVFEVWPGEFEFVAGLGGPNPEAQVLSIRNRGAGVLNWEITEDCPWLDVAPTSGESSGEVNEVTVSVDVSGLGWGEYNCELTVSDPCALNSPQTIDVNLVIAPPVIEVSATVFEFAAEANGPNPPDQTLTIRNSGGGTLNWEIVEDCGWLSVEPNSGSSTGEVNSVSLSVDISGLAEGAYYCQLTVSDPNAENSPQTVDVSLVISVPPPVIEVSPAWFEFTAFEGCANPSLQILSIRNAGDGTLNWEVMEDCPWLEATPGSGSSVGEVDEVYIVVDISGLVAGDYSCVLNVSDANAANNPQTVDVALHVVAANSVIGLTYDAEAYAYAAHGPYITDTDQKFSTNARVEAQAHAIIDDVFECGDDDYAWYRDDAYTNVSVECLSSVEGSWLMSRLKGWSIWSECDCIGHCESGTGGSDGNGYTSLVGTMIASENLYLKVAAEISGSAPELWDQWHWWFKVWGDDANNPLVVIDDANMSANLALSEGQIVNVELYHEAGEESWPGSGLESTLTVGLIVAPIMEVSGTEFWFDAQVGGSNPASQVLSIRNSGVGTLNWEIMEGCLWLTAEPNSGSSTGETDEVTLSVDISWLAAGLYNCELIVSGDGAAGSPQIVGVTLYVSDGYLHVPSQFGTIQAAIDAAQPGETVIVAEGTYTGAGNRDIDFNGKAITVRSMDPEDPDVVAATVIDCQGSFSNPHRGFYFHSGEDGNSIVSGLTIKRGRVNNKGGGIYCTGSSPTIEDCIIRSNRANGSGGSYPGGIGGDGYGGGVYNTSGSPRFVRCTISYNIAVGGPGGGSPDISMPGDGGRGYGGGMYGSGPTIEDCVIINNRALGGEAGTNWGVLLAGWAGDAYGGGIYGSVVINDTVISGNTARGGVFDYDYFFGFPGEAYGGGIYGNSVISNCLVIDNVADDRDEGHWGNSGAGVYGGATISNCTICNNVALNGVGGVGGAATVTDCILWGNGDDLGGCSATYSCIEDGDAGEGNISEDPCFVSGPEGDYYLSQIAAGQAYDSPCVDLGSDTAFNLGMDMYTTRTDEIGDAGIVDMGYHYSMPNPADIDGDGDVDEVDYAILASQWRQAPGVPSADIAPPGGNGVVDGLDLELLARNYLWGK